MSMHVLPWLGVMGRGFLQRSDFLRELNGAHSILMYTRNNVKGRIRCYCTGGGGGRERERERDIRTMVAPVGSERRWQTRRHPEALICHYEHANGEPDEVNRGERGSGKTCHILYHSGEKLIPCSDRNHMQFLVDKFKYQVGSSKEVRKNVPMPSMPSSNIRTSPKRKKSLCCFLPAAHRVFQAGN